MAAFQVCLQIWLTVSLLADGLAVAGQVRYDYTFTLSIKHLVVLIHDGFISKHWIIVNCLSKAQSGSMSSYDLQNNTILVSGYSCWSIC